MQKVKNKKIYHNYKGYKMTLKEFLKTEEKIDTRTFGKFVRERREAMKISVRKMSYLLGITPTYLSDIERGKRTSPTKC